MKHFKSFLFAFLTAAATMAFFSLAAASPSPLHAAPNAAPYSEWNYFIFLDDADGSAMVELNKLETCGSNSFVNILAFWFDRSINTSTVFSIKKDSKPNTISSPVLKTSRITDSTNALAELERFVIDYSKKYPSNRTCLTVYTRNSIIIEKSLAVIEKRHVIKDFASTLSRIASARGKKTDVLHFDAHNFQCLELAYEVAPFVDFLVGSEEAIPVYGTPYAEILGAVTAQKPADTRRFSFIFVSEWHNFYKKFAKHAVRATLSSLNTAEVPMVTEKFNEFLGALTADLKDPKFKKIFVDSIMKKIRRYLDDRMIDAFDLGRLVNEEIAEETVEQRSREFLASITNFTVRNSAFGDYGKIPGTYNSFGVSMFMPLPGADIDNYSDLEFVKNTGWKDFLNFFYSFSMQKNW